MFCWLEIAEMGVFFLVILSCASIIVLTVVSGVPPLPSSRSQMNDICELLAHVGLQKKSVIYDLGSGWGDVLIAVAKAYPDADVRGIEISPVPYLISIIRTLRIRRVSVRYGNFRQEILSDADAVICYLMPESMDDVSNFLDISIVSGTHVVSNTFLFRKKKFVSVRRGKSRGAVAIYRWGEDASS